MNEHEQKVPSGRTICKPETQWGEGTETMNGWYGYGNQNHYDWSCANQDYNDRNVHRLGFLWQLMFRQVSQGWEDMQTRIIKVGTYITGSQPKQGLDSEAELDDPWPTGQVCSEHPQSTATLFPECLDCGWFCVTTVVWGAPWFDKHKVSVIWTLSYGTFANLVAH